MPTAQTITNTRQLWDSVLVDIELTVSKANFNTWFKETYIIKVDKGAVFLCVPNTFVKEWLSSKYHTTILKSLRNIASHIRSLEYTIGDTAKKRKPQEISAPSQDPSVSGELPLNELYINKADNLNPRYSFDSFVVGPFNELAHAAAQAVIKKPGITYNPLFIYGNTGHGKTHLIQAIGNYIKSHDETKKVFYVTSETFAIDYVKSIQTNKPNSFKEKYRKYDVLIMDDIQFLSNKEKTQEELFHLFNTLYDNNKQIVFSSDQHPNFIPNLEDRLKSRFGAGMIVDIPQPDNESRVAILTTKLQQTGKEVSPEILLYLAENTPGNIRELEGALNSVVCQADLKDRQLTIPEVRNLIKNSKQTQKSVSPQEVIKIIANFYNIEEESIYKKSRKKEVIKPRQLSMYILREDYSISYPSIGEKIGGRDHTTVIHSCEKIKKELKTDNLLLQELEQIRSMLIR